jgi:hypothetical protein
MMQFEFTGREKTVLFAGMGLGVVCLLLTFLFDDPYHSRTWSNYLQNTSYFLFMAFTALFALSAFTTAYAGWFVVMKRVWESMTQWLLPATILLGVVLAGVWLHGHHLYHWTDAAAVEADSILAHKSSFLNSTWYTIGAVVFTGVWIFFANRMFQISKDEDKNGTTEYKHYKRYKKYAAAFLPIGGFTSAFVIWLVIMSIDAHWYSTLFAWYATASAFVGMIALTILVLIYLKSRGYFENVTAEHLHDLGKYLFAFSIFWTYLWFSQYMLIWYANVGEETVYFQLRRDDYPVLFYGNLVINFILPFFVLMRNDTKRKFGTLFFAALFVFLGHWWDYFQMVKPGVRATVIEAMEHHGAGEHGDDVYTGEATGAEEHGGEAHSDGDHGATDGELMASAAGGEAGHAEEAHGEHSLGYAAGFTLPGLLELGTMIGFLSLFLFLFFRTLASAPLEPVNDPYLAESEHHHT